MQILYFAILILITLLIRFAYSSKEYTVNENMIIDFGDVISENFNQNEKMDSYLSNSEVQTEEEKPERINFCIRPPADTKKFAKLIVKDISPITQSCWTKSDHVVDGFLKRCPPLVIPLEVQNSGGVEKTGDNTFTLTSSAFTSDMKKKVSIVARLEALAKFEREMQLLD